MKKLLSITLLLAYVGFATAQTSGTTPKKQETKSVDHSHDGHNHGPAATATSGPEPKGEPKSEEKAPNPNAAKLIFKEESYNFTEIPEGPQVTHEFKFSNTGKEPLILSNVRASCGCTTPSWPKEPILPGKDGTILVTYNTQGRPGAFNKTITITSNADESNKVISIKGEVIKAEPEKSVPLEQPSLLAPKN